MTNQAVTPVTDDKLPVTLVTAGAGRPEDDDAFMRELRDLRDGLAQKLRQKPSLAQMLDLLGEPARRKAFWAHRLADPPTRTTFPPEARAVIRTAVGEAPPPTPAEVVNTMISERAAMWLVGTLEPGERVDRVLMLANTDAVQIYANGTVSAKRVQGDLRPATEKGIQTSVGENVTHVTPIAPSLGANENARSVRQRAGVSVTRATTAQNERRQTIGATWQDVIEAGLQALEHKC